jgi:hypothetical protein
MCGYREQQRLTADTFGLAGMRDIDSQLLRQPQSLKEIRNGTARRHDASRADFKADFKAGKPPYRAPPEIHPIMERATAELAASGQASRAIKAGDRVVRLSNLTWRKERRKRRLFRII